MVEVTRRISKLRGRLCQGGLVHAAQTFGDGAGTNRRRHDREALKNNPTFQEPRRALDGDACGPRSQSARRPKRPIKDPMPRAIAAVVYGRCSIVVRTTSSASLAR